MSIDFDFVQKQRPHELECPEAFPVSTRVKTRS